MNIKGNVLFKKGNTCGVGNKSNLGKKLSEETKKRMSMAKRKENHPNWKGGTAKESSKKWRKEHKEMLNFYNKRRRARKTNNGGFHTLKEWETLKAQYNWTCPCCKRKEPEIKLTEDHIIPLSRGGSDNIENIQPLCSKCNSDKNTKIVAY